ncbi:MAG TPA: YfcE family phosphodiesterase [Solirubrobacterales bacterium]|nr:YfcE family phosphodiesterase [Solirubrobacterales bacterium]
MATRVAILSDTHLTAEGHLPAVCLEAVRRADVTLHAGDVSAAVVLVEISRAARRLHAVHGNVDAPELRRGLPEEVSIRVEEAKIALVHDAGPAKRRLERLRRRFPDADAVVFGHSHMPLLEQGRGFQIFNPGSPTQRRRAPSHTFGVAAVDGTEIRFEHVALD